MQPYVVVEVAAGFRCIPYDAEQFYALETVFPYLAAQSPTTKASFFEVAGSGGPLIRSVQL